MQVDNLIFSDLKLVIEQAYKPLNYSFNDLKLPPESADYSACSFRLNNHKVVYRCAKITPTKTGQFVAIWKRDYLGKTTPFCSTDDFDFFIITVCDNNQLGQFIFPKHVLIKRGIITHHNKQGKRGVRVYPPWNVTTSKQAQTTQNWQLNYFVHINPTPKNLATVLHHFFTTE